MTICNKCKLDPVVAEKNEALKVAPWGLTVAPPPGAGLPEFRLCLRCTVEVFHKLLELLAPPEA